MSRPGTGRGGEPPVVLAVSPHLDDAAFSAGALLAGLAAQGADVRVVTVFTAGAPDPQGFALACQTDKGLPPDVDYMALRRTEDETAMAALGAQAVHLGLPEAPHRGYDSAAALFGPVPAADESTPKAVLGALEQELARPGMPPPDLVLGPAALGDHVDHRHVRDALDMLSHQHGLAVVRWDDLPYALRLAPHLRGVHRRRASPAETTAKLTACASYPTQLGFQFGSVTAMREALRPVPETFSEDPEQVPGLWPGPGPGA